MLGRSLVFGSLTLSRGGLPLQSSEVISSFPFVSVPKRQIIHRKGFKTRAYMNSKCSIFVSSGGWGGGGGDRSYFISNAHRNAAFSKPVGCRLNQPPPL